MKRLFLIVCLLFSVSCGNVSAGELQACYAEAQSQQDKEDCAGKYLQQAEEELNRVYEKIQGIYEEDRAFLEKLKKSQAAWKKSRDADFELKFPHFEEMNFYGTVYSMCSDEYKARLTIQRTEYLKQWIIGSKTGDTCRGSQVPESYLKAILKDEYPK